MKKNVAGQKIGAQMVSATDGSAFTGAVTVYVCGDAGSQGAGSVGAGACTHEGNGYHTYAPAQAETNYDLIAFTFIGSGAVPATVQVFTSYPQTGDAFARLGAPTGASVSADVAAVKAETALIVEDTGTTLPAALTAIDDFIDTEVAAIKAKTDNLPSDPADQSAVEAAITSATSSLATAANLAVVDTVVDAILADTGTDGVKIHTTQGAVTFGQVKILASASGEGAFHIVNSASGSSGKGMYVEGGEQGTMNYASESGGIALRNRATGSFSYGQINESTGASGTGQGNAGAFADINGDITGSISGVAAGGIDTTTFTSGALNAIADAVLKRDWSGLTGEASRSLLNALRFLRNKWSISGTTLTVTKEDDATSAWTATLSTDGAADPVTGSDPA